MEVKPLIFYKTTADFNNTGEVLIYKTLLENLREYGNVIVDNSPHIQPAFLDRIGIREDEKLHRYTNLSFTNYILLTALKNVFRNRPVYFATGVGDHVVNGLSGAIKNLLSFFFVLLIRISGVKVLRIGMSIKFNGKLAGLSEQMLAMLIPNYYVRDSISLENCHQIKVRAKIAPDLSWGYKVSNHNEANSNAVLILFSFRDYVRKQQPEPYRTQLYNAIGILLEHICKDKGKEIILTYQCDYDKHVQEEILKRFGHLGNIKIATELITLNNAEEYYGNASIVVTNRLHVLLLGYKYGALTVGLTDLDAHKKIRGIFHDENLDNHLIDIRDTKTQICSQYDALVENVDAEWCMIHQAENKNYKALKAVFNSIFN